MMRKILYFLLYSIIVDCGYSLPQSTLVSFNQAIFGKSVELASYSSQRVDELSAMYETLYSYEHTKKVYCCVGAGIIAITTVLAIVWSISQNNKKKPAIVLDDGALDRAYKEAEIELLRLRTEGLSFSALCKTYVQDAFAASCGTLITMYILRYFSSIEQYYALLPYQSPDHIFSQGISLLLLQLDSCMQLVDGCRRCSAAEQLPEYAQDAIKNAYNGLVVGYEHCCGSIIGYLRKHPYRDMTKIDSLMLTLEKQLARIRMDVEKFLQMTSIEQRIKQADVIINEIKKQCNDVCSIEYFIRHDVFCVDSLARGSLYVT